MKKICLYIELIRPHSINQIEILYGIMLVDSIAYG